MDARPNEVQQDADDLVISQDSQRIIPLTDNTDKATISVLAIAKYLPAHVFRNPNTLIHKLDTLEIEVKSINSQSRNYMLVNIAKNIAFTTLELNLDYGSKLTLIEAALSHSIFKPKGFAMKIINLIANRIRRIDTQNEHCNEAQAILYTAITDLRKNRNAIILC